VAAENRLSTGVPGLDDLLGGGLIPGTLTVVCGATGIGKTQLGLQFAAISSRHTPCAVAGRETDGDPDGTRSVPAMDSRGILFDMSSRGDSQSHAEYARRMFDWKLTTVDPDAAVALDGFFDPARQHGDYLHVFRYHGRRVTRRDLDWDDWNQWQAELNARLRSAIAFFYGNFVRGCRRVVIDGIEPVDRPAESIQFNLFEYIYHQVLRKDPEWVARDLFREQYRRHADEAAAHVYDPAQIGCLLLATSAETMLDDLISRPLDEGDVFSNANTLILMGKIRDGDTIRRALYIAKHRGSACDERIVEYRINDQGLEIV
jgi:KaiC/GvpD/RAD55 family RecA-like ATPase